MLVLNQKQVQKKGKVVESNFNPLEDSESDQADIVRKRAAAVKAKQAELKEQEAKRK